jgi:hypothetical protein
MPVSWRSVLATSFMLILKAFIILTDLTCAFLPISFLITPHRPLHEKILLGFLMSLGLLATALGAAKLSTFKLLQTTTDFIYDSTMFAICS